MPQKAAGKDEICQVLIQTNSEAYSTSVLFSHMSQEIPLILQANVNLL